MKKEHKEKMNTRGRIEGHDYSYFSVSGIILCLFLLFLFGPGMLKAASAKKTGKNLILNSNLSVPNYAIAQANFKSRLEGNWLEVDLGEKEMDQGKVKRIIRDEDPDLIYAIGSKAYLLTNKFARKRNIVFSSAINWQRLPLSTNTYGISNELPSGMQLTMYRYLFPELKKIGVIYSEKFNKEWLKSAVKDGKDMDIDIIGKAIKKPADLAAALQDLLPRVDVLWLTSDPVVISSRESVVEIFNQTSSITKPVFAYSEVFADFGALLVISADVPTMGMQAADLAEDLLDGNEITNKVSNPAGSHITLNMKKVKEYGVNFNNRAMDSVNRIIK